MLFAVRSAAVHVPPVKAAAETAVDPDDIAERLRMTVARLARLFTGTLNRPQEALAHFRALNPDPTTRIPGCPTGFTYGAYLKYAVFHIAYHTGQIVLLRKLQGSWDSSKGVS